MISYIGNNLYRIFNMEIFIGGFSRVYTYRKIPQVEISPRRRYEGILVKIAKTVTTRKTWYSQSRSSSSKNSNVLVMVDRPDCNQNLTRTKS